jgi:Flp pilus assembly protein CpaB
MVLQDVMVLASDQTVEMKDNKPVTMTTVTLAVSPQEAERLALAQNEGKVTLALRNLQDNAQITTPGVTTAQLLGSPAPAPAAAKPQAKASASAKRVTAKRSAPPATAAPQPAVAAPSPATTPAPQPAPSVPRHTVSVIKGASATDVVFMQDGERGWLEAPSKADGAKRP